MSTSGASKVIPIILTAITLATALFFYKQREVLRQKTEELLNRSTKQTTARLPEPTLSPAPTSTIISQTNESNETNLTNKPKDTVCTPVYGMANTCAEHAVVDTALDTSIFYNLAGLSYFAGLAAFVRAKTKRA